MAVASGAGKRTAYYSCSGGQRPTLTPPTVQSALNASLTVRTTVNPNGTPAVLYGATLPAVRAVVPGPGNDIIFTAKSLDSTNLSVTYTVQSDFNQGMDISVSGGSITIKLAASGTSASEVIDAITFPSNLSESDAAALVTVQMAPGDGAGTHYALSAMGTTRLVRYDSTPVAIPASTQTVDAVFTAVAPDTPYTVYLWAVNECPIDTPNFSDYSTVTTATQAEAGLHVMSDWVSTPTNSTQTISGSITAEPDTSAGASGATVTCSASDPYDSNVVLGQLNDLQLCTTPFASASAVKLTVTAGPNSFFAGWTGPDCAGWGLQPVCYTTVVGALDVSAVFSNRPQLAVVFGGDGTGAVTSTPAGISCTTTTTLCQAPYAIGTSVTLTATPDSGGSFLGWGGDAVACGTTTTCTVTVDADLNVSADFGGKPTLYIFRAGTGSGTVTSGGNEINCSALSPLCSATYGVGTTVALTATPAPGSTFAGWGTDLASCYGNAPTCTITTSFTQTVTAIFSKGTTLAVTPSGNGSGVVTTSPSGVSCPPDCSSIFPEGSGVTLSAYADDGSVFGGWDDGPCFDRDDAAPCTVTLVDDMQLPVVFTDPSLPALTARTRTSLKGCTIVGTSRNDKLVGTSADDVICGAGGNDTIVGNGGNDVLNGGNGNDKLLCSSACRVYGGAGNDTLMTKGRGFSELFGGAGNDLLLGHNNARTLIDGGTGRNTARYDRRLDALRKIQKKL